MFSKVLSLLFPETNHEKVLGIIELLKPSPLVIVTHNNLRVLTCARYDDVNVRAAINILKKHDTEHAIRLLSRLLNDVLLEELANSTIWNPNDYLIVPMPISKKRRYERGFSQMEKIVHALPDTVSPHIACDILKRTRDAKMQKILTRKERLRNTQGTFAIADVERLKGTRVILIDDVIATGATMAEAAKTLQEAGAKVSAVALARA